MDPSLLKAIDLGSIPAVAAGVAAAFKWIEEALNTEAKTGIRQWLTNAKTSTIVEPWPKSLVGCHKPDFWLPSYFVAFLFSFLPGITCRGTSRLVGDWSAARLSHFF